MKGSLLSLVSISFCLLLAGLVKGQTNNSQYQFVTIDEGFPKSAITDIIQGHDGLIWIATNGEGLYQYNGTDLKVYKHNPKDSNSINSSIVNTLFLDSDDTIWVGTEEGLNKYDLTLDAFEEIKISGIQSEDENYSIFSIRETSNKSLLIGTPGNGLYKLAPNTLSIQKINERLSLNSTNIIINSMLPIEDGNMLLGTNSGLFIYNETLNIWEKKRFETANGPEEIDYAIESLAIDKENNLLIGTFNRGLVRINTSSEIYTSEVFDFTKKRIFDIEITSDHTILCATENDGLFVLEANGKVTENYRYNKTGPDNILSNSIWSICLDAQDRIWIGYYNRGIGVYDALYDKFSDLQSIPNKKNSLQSPSVTGIVQDDDNHLLIAMDGGGIDKYNLKTKEFFHLSGNTNIKGLDKLDVQTIYLDKKRNLWAGTWSSGIYYLKKGSNTFINYNTANTKGRLTSNRITGFSEDSEGTIWIATYFGGLHSFNSKTKEFLSHSNDSFKIIYGNEGHIRAVFVDHNDNIWLGTPKGLFKVISSDKATYQTIAINEPISNNAIVEDKINTRTIFEDSKDNIWFGTYGKGLGKITTQNNHIEWFHTKEGLSIENISSIIEDNNNNIWVSGDTGLSMLDTQTKEFSNYNKEDGLLVNNFNFNSVLKDNNGILYFGSYEGIDYFNPNKIIQNQNEPIVYLTDFKLFNTSVVPAAKGSTLTKNISEIQKLTLKPSEFVFTLEFAAINFTRANTNQYAYYLEGFEENWNYVGNNRSATYTNLSPGDYTFHVKASNNDGVWAENPLSLPITILAPWWATSWAVLLYILLFIGLAWSINWFLNKRLEDKRTLKLEREQRQQEDLLNEKKIQFFTNISHEFRTPLTLIINPITDIIESNQMKLNKGLKDKHRIIYRNAQRMKNLIDELMDFRKLHLNRLTLNASQIDAFKFVKEVVEHFEEEAFEKNIILTTESDDKESDFWADPGLLEKVIFNLLSNAFKATAENGIITLGVYVSKEKILFPLVNKDIPVSALEIIIEDTGFGISKEDIEHIFERFYRAKDRNQQYYGGSGTGIGLELVQSFVELHKGKVEVQSEDGEGTKFKLLFPLGKEHLFESTTIIPSLPKFNANIDPTQVEIDSNTGNPIEATTSLSFIDKDKKTILLVEDNKDLRNYIKTKLRTEYTVIEAENGQKGIQLALKGLPDIIITDIIMPEMDGFEFCKKIKEDLKTSHIPVIMLTAKAMSSDKIKGIDSGADAYLNKPFEMKLLRSYLKRLLVSRQQSLQKNIHENNTITLLEHTTAIDKTFMQRVLDFITENISEPDLNVEYLAEDMALSRSQLYRKIKSITGLTATELIRKIRLEKAKRMIENGSESISEVGFKVGFSSPSYFSKCFKNEFGVLPTELKTTF